MIGFIRKTRFGWREWLFAAVTLVMLVAGMVLAWRQRASEGPTAVIDGRIIVRVEVADTVRAREQGLSGHAPLGPDEGMFFVFPEADRYTFWMKEMLFPIDILWIRGTELVDITTDAPAPADFGEPLPLYRPAVPADRVLEVRAGFAREHGLRLGMPVELRY